MYFIGLCLLEMIQVIITVNSENPAVLVSIYWLESSLNNNEPLLRGLWQRDSARFSCKSWALAWWYQSCPWRWPVTGLTGAAHAAQRRPEASFRVGYNEQTVTFALRIPRERFLQRGMFSHASCYLEKRLQGSLPIPSCEIPPGFLQMIVMHHCNLWFSV